MNLRLSGDDIRFRVTAEEFERFSMGRNLALEIPFPGQHVFRIAVRMEAMGDWKLDSDPTGLWLSIPRARIFEFAQSLPNREGLTHDFDVGNGKKARVVFEVDMHT
jgi:hypothetical protein